MRNEMRYELRSLRWKPLPRYMYQFVFTFCRGLGNICNAESMIRNNVHTNENLVHRMPGNRVFCKNVSEASRFMNKSNTDS